MWENPRLTAVFAPLETSELSDEALKWIGWKGEWEVTHLCEEGHDDWPTGTPLCTVSKGVLERGEPHPPADAFVWAPISDLASIEWDERTEAHFEDQIRETVESRFPPP
ncbi:MAG TPA: hypothetical protein VMS11_07315 [Solirubrobacterales bacterium]|nr:hypothetical protein [Solirubrobacterales bacterium]